MISLSSFIFSTGDNNSNSPAFHSSQSGVPGKILRVLNLKIVGLISVNTLAVSFTCSSE